MDPVVLFFLLGLIARLLKSDLRLPEALYETLSIFLLLAIGIKGGIELAKQPILSLAPQVLGVVLMGCLIPVLLFPILRLGKLARTDAASIAAHYGSVSVVTFAVASAYLSKQNIAFESYMPLFVAVLEAPGIIIGIILARSHQLKTIKWRILAHEVLCGKSVLLLVGGILIGALVGAEGLKPIAPLFLDLFKGVLALFLLEMGLVAGGRLKDLKKAGVFLVLFGVCVPPILACLGLSVAYLLGLSLGGSILLAAMAASASYIAAPTAMRIAVPEANPALSIGLALGITFPFNIMLGIPLYQYLATQFVG